MKNLNSFLSNENTIKSVVIVHYIQVFPWPLPIWQFEDILLKLVGQKNGFHHHLSSPRKRPSGGLTTQIASVHMALPAGRNLGFNVKKDRVLF